MRAYVGHTSDPAFIAELIACGIGECVSRREYPPIRTPWFFDNGAYVDYMRGIPFNAEAWWQELAEVALHPVPPDFVVAPDVVAGGLASLEMSVGWVDRLRELGVRPYLVVQDGMAPNDVAGPLGRFDGLFVGGSTRWKMNTAGTWCDFAHEHGKPCHVGRVGTGRRVRWAREIGADSIDSSQPLWSRDHMRVFLRALAVEDIQGRLW